MTRGKVLSLSLIMERKPTTNRKKCENHLDYLLRRGKLAYIKRGGKVNQDPLVNVDRVTKDMQSISVDQVDATCATAPETVGSLRP